MTAEIEIDVRPSGKTAFTARIPGAWSIESDANLQQLMDRCNREFGDPAKNIGGPRLPAVNPK